MEDKIIKKMEESINKLLEEGLTTTNLDTIYKLSKIKHMAKEEEKMNYGNYGNYGNYEGYGNYNGRGPGHGSYGEYGNYSGNYGEYGDNYGRRGRDRRYRGHDNIDRMYGDYGRYMESRERYGAGEETDKSFHYMVKSLEDFIRVLHEEAETPQQKQQLMAALQNSMK